MDLALLGGRIKAERKLNGLTLENLAEMINISRNYLWEIEAGRKAPALGTLYSIGTTLDISIDYLLGASNVRRSISDAEPVGRTAVIIRMLNECGDKELSLISNMVEDIGNYLKDKK